MRFLLLAQALFCTLAVANELQDRFVSVRADREVFVRYRKAEANQPTLVLLNGLTYSTKEWRGFVEALDRIDRRIGLVLYDMDGMGETLLRNRDIVPVPLQTQVDDLDRLLSAIKPSGPIYFLGLSYGGAVGILYTNSHPDKVAGLIAVAPYLHRMPSQDSLIRAWVSWHRATYPFDPRSENEIYDLYLRHNVYTTYPLAEPVLLENPFKIEGVYQLARAAKNWDASGVARTLPERKLHIVAGESDEYVSLGEQEAFWRQTNAGARASFLVVRGARHKVTEHEPNLVACWALQILRENPRLREGRRFSSNRLGDLCATAH